MLTEKQKERKRLKRLARREAFEKHRARNPKDTPSYKAYKALQAQYIGQMQKEQEKRNLEEKKIGNKIKKFFNPVTKLLPKRQTNRGK